jgi:hypothetical protein
MRRRSQALHPHVPCQPLIGQTNSRTSSAYTTAYIHQFLGLGSNDAAFRLPCFTTLIPFCPAIIHILQNCGVGMPRIALPSLRVEAAVVVDGVRFVVALFCFLYQSCFHQEIQGPEPSCAGLRWLGPPPSSSYSTMTAAPAHIVRHRHFPWASLASTAEVVRVAFRTSVFPSRTLRLRRNAPHLIGKSGQR